MKKKVVFCFLALWALILQAACGAPTPVVEPAEIRFLHTKVDSAFYTRVAEEFKAEYPEITVNLTPVDFVSLSQVDTLKPDCLAASLFGLGSQSDMSQRFISLDGFLEQEKALPLEDYYPGPLSMATWEGKTWAIPAGMNLVVMYYNQNLFDRAGIPYPKPGWTWQDFLNAAIAITNQEAGVWGFAPLMDIVDPLMFIFQNGGNIVDDLQNPTRVTFNDPLTVEALEWYANLFHGYKVAPTQKDISSQGAIYRLIFGGNVGMWSMTFDQRGGEWSERNFEPPFDVGIAPLPRNARAATYGEVYAYAITASSPSPDACWRWINFLSSRVNPANRLAPVRKSLAESKDYEQVVGSEAAAAVRAAIEAAIVPPSVDQFAAFSPSFEAFGVALERLLAGELNAQEAMDWAQQQAEK